MKFTNPMRISLLALVLALPGIACADVIDYAVTAANQLGTVDLQTGAFTQIGTVNGIAGGFTGDLTRRPGGLIYGLDSGANLVLIDPVALTTSLVGYTGYAIYGLTFMPDGTLYGLANTSASLFSINPKTGAATPVGTLTGAGFGSAASYFDIRSDDAGHVYMLNGSDTLYTINLTNLQVTLVGTIGFTVYNLDFENGTLYGFTNGKQIISINTTNGAGTVVATETQTSAIVAATGGGGIVGAPFLTIQPTNLNAVALSWIAPSNAYSLQQNLNLTTTSWASVPNPVSVTNSQNQVIVSPDVGTVFYRLKSN
jgi:hypothetical protein